MNLKVISGVCAVGLTAAYLACKHFLNKHKKRMEAEYPLVESQLVSKHSVYMHVNHGKMYRLVYIAHKLGPEIPLLFFIHGMGAQLLHFEAQISHFSRIANILAVDLVGHGKSEKSSKTEDFNLENMALDLLVIFQRYKLSQNVIIAHSLGCPISVHLYKHISVDIQAMVFIGPRYSMPKSLVLPLFGYIVPTMFLDIIRYFDQKKRLNSSGITHFLSPDATLEVKQRQMAINLRSSSLTLTKLLCNLSTFPTDLDWSRISCPVQCIIGDYEEVNRKEQVDSILNLISNAYPLIIIPNSGHNCHLENAGYLNAMISHFLIDDVKIKTLDASHQLRVMYNNHMDKWSMKNYEKWKQTECVSAPVGGTMIRGMKVMREGDDEHSPWELRDKYPSIGLVVDISKDAPPYDTSKVDYVKVSTISKIPPTQENVKEFLSVLETYWEKSADKEVAVHCHYGFNRTGFLICCYLIETKGFSVTEALGAWRTARFPGIKHPHFRDELYMRYERN